jgi:hypothetical protein
MGPGLSVATTKQKMYRVALSVPEPIYQILSDLSAASGVNRTALVMTQITRAVPYWLSDLKRLGGAGAGPDGRSRQSGLSVSERPNVPGTSFQDEDEGEE